MQRDIICGILLLAVLLLLIRLLRIRHQLRSIAAELRRTRDQDYNRKLTVPLFDRALNEAAAEINHNLDYQQQRKLAAELAEQRLRQSVSDIAHDLRTPMTVIKGNLQLIEQSEQLTPAGREQLAVCSEKVSVLKKMADDFFELSVLESDSSKVPLQKVSLTAVLMQFIADHEAVIRMHELEPDIQFPAQTVYVMADPEMLNRMLENLLNNTLRYAKGSFVLRLEPDGAVFENDVESAKLPDPSRMFERSYRADASRSSGSAGLGLYIVRLLAEKQQAEASAALSGSQLSIRLRFQRAPERSI